MGHDHHFLSRLDRVCSEHVQLALSLYRDQELLKHILDHAGAPQDAERIAISLSHPERGPFIVVTRGPRRRIAKHRGWPLAPLMLLAVGCSPSAVQLADRGQLVEACQAAAPQEVSAVVDRVVASSDLKVRIAASSRTDTCKAAEIAAPNKADKPWMVVSIDVEPGTLGTALQEVTFESPWIRAAGWTSRYAAIGDSYTLLTGKQLPARGTSASIQDLVVWSGEALLGNQESRAKIAANFASVDMPEDVVAAQRLTTLLAPSCSAHAHAGCRTAALVVPGEAATGKPAAIGMSVKYAVQGRDTESRCTLWEHVVVPLSPGSDLIQQVSAAIPPQEGSWMLVRSKAMRFGAMAEDPFFEFDQSSH